MSESKPPVRVEFKQLDRTNFLRMLTLQVGPGQERFVATPAKSIAASYVRQYGDNFVYDPRVICDGDRVVGFVTTFCDPATADEYWIDDILIDAAEQGKGYGRAAMLEVLRLIPASYPQCRAVRLTCFHGNEVAAALYRSLGFREIGVNELNGEPDYELSGAALEAFR